MCYITLNTIFAFAAAAAMKQSIILQTTLFTWTLKVTAETKMISIMLHHIQNYKSKELKTLNLDLEFVATVVTGGRVNFLSAV